MSSTESESVVDAYARNVAEHEAELATWYAALAAKGVHVASPDDGWVNRKLNYWMPPSYAHIRGGLGIGTVVALGTPKSYRLVKVKKVEALGFDRAMQRYYFDEVRR